MLESAHHAWCDGDIDRALLYYADDCTYWCNAGTIEGTPLTLDGKKAFRAYLNSILAAAESRTVIELFQYDGEVARAQVDGYVRHRRTGHVLAGSYRQIVTFRGNKIWRTEEYHDAAKMAAFWRLVASEETAGDSF